MLTATPPRRLLNFVILVFFLLGFVSACGPRLAGPYLEYYVDTSGTDSPDRGTTSGRPWRTIQYALDHADYSGSKPVRINVAAGSYVENLAITHSVRIVGAGSGDPLTTSGLTVIMPAPRSASEGPLPPPVPMHTVSGGARLELYDLVFQRSRLMVTGGSFYMENVWFVQTWGRYAVRLRDVGVFDIVNCDIHTRPGQEADTAVEIVNSVGEIQGGNFGDDFDHTIDIQLSGSPTDTIIGDGYIYRSGAAHVTVDGVTIHGGPVGYADGIRISNRATAIIRNSTITRDSSGAEPFVAGSSDGMAAGINLLDPQGSGGSTVEISGNTISGFDVGIGMDIGGYRVKASGNDISALTDVARTQNYYGTDESTPRIDFGGGPLGSPGGNTFENADMFAFNHQRPFEVYACFNDWQVADSQIDSRVHDRMDDPGVGPVYWGREGDPCGSASEPLLAVSPTVTPTLVQIFTATPSLQPKPVLIFKLNAFCRTGPGTAYPDAGSFEKGQQTVIDGRNDEDPRWWWVRKPNSNEHCWVSYITGDPSGPLDAVPVQAASSPPPATEVPPQGPACSQINDAKKCNTAGCQWTANNVCIAK